MKYLFPLFVFIFSFLIKTSAQLRNVTADITPSAGGRYEHLTTDSKGNVYVFQNLYPEAGRLWQYNQKKWSKIEQGGKDFNGVIQMLTHPDGTLYLWPYREKGGKYKFHAWQSGRWSTLPELDDTNMPSGMFIGPGNELMLYGLFPNGGKHYFLLKWNGQQWSPVETTVSDKFLQYLLMERKCKSILTGKNGQLYAYFFKYDKPTRNYFAVCKNNEWSLLDTAAVTFNSTVRDVALDSKDNLYVAGYYADDTKSHCLAKWDGNSWSILSKNEEYIECIAVDGQDGVLFAGQIGPYKKKTVNLWKNNTESIWAGAEEYLYELALVNNTLFAVTGIGSKYIFKMEAGEFALSKESYTPSTAVTNISTTPLPTSSSTSSSTSLPSGPRYRKVESNYGNNRFLLFQDDKSKKEWGLMNSSGLVILEQKYKSINYFMMNKHGIADIKGMNETTYSIIDSTGKPLLEGLEEVRNFFDGRAAVKQKGKWGYMNNKAAIVIPCEFEKDENFYDGMIITSKSDPASGKINYGLIDTTGKIIIRFLYAGLDGFAGKNIIFKEHASNKWGIMDMKEKIVLAPAYDSMRIDFGYIVAGKAGKYGVLDSMGKVKVALKYDDLETLLSTPDIARVTLGKKVGLVNLKTGAPIGTMYDQIGNFSSGLADIKLNGKYGFINTDGKLVIPAIYEEARIFFDSGSTDQTKVKLNGKVIIIDKTGKKIRDTNLTTVYDQ